VKWFVLRSASISWTVEDHEKNKSASARIDRQAAFLATNGIKNCSAKACELVSEHIVDMPSLREQISKITDYVRDLELTLE